MADENMGELSKEEIVKFLANYGAEEEANIVFDRNLDSCSVIGFATNSFHGQANFVGSHPDENFYRIDISSQFLQPADCYVELDAKVQTWMDESSDTGIRTFSCSSKWCLAELSRVSKSFHLVFAKDGGEVEQAELRVRIAKRVDETHLSTYSRALFKLGLPLTRTVRILELLEPSPFSLRRLVRCAAMVCNREALCDALRQNHWDEQTREVLTQADADRTFDEMLRDSQTGV